MLAVIAHGEDTFRLIDGASRDIGWVRAKTIGFSGFISENIAHAAAVAGGRALARSLKQEFGVSHLEIDDHPNPRTIRGSDGEWVVDGPVRIARLLRVENGDGSEIAIEFQLPPYANTAVAINAAQIAYGALSRELGDGSGRVTSPSRAATQTNGRRSSHHVA